MRLGQYVTGVLALAVWVVLPCRTALGVEWVNITLPSAVSFAVTNATIATTGTPNPTQISFSLLSVLTGHALRISIQANASTFTPPAGTATIPASNVSWTTSGAVNGTGYSGTLSSVAPVRVFQSTAGRTTGSVNLIWQLAAPGSAIRAGSHTLVARWILESVVP
jgi:hypothetical protein